MFENAFNNIDKALRAEEGTASELDYTEQTSWVLFLKYLDDLEVERADVAELENRDYTPILDAPHQWKHWAAPKTAAGAFDHNRALTGDDLISFINTDLFPYLARFRDSATGPDTIEYKIGEIFTEIVNKFRSGYILRDVLEIIDGLNFNTQDAKHELSDLYETRIKKMGNAGRNGGEYYTPRPLIRAMIQVTDPKIGETIYDGAVGSAGFLCEAYSHMRPKAQGPEDFETLQKRTFYGQEKKSLAYIIGIMNMVLHGIETPNIVHTNTLNENVMDIQEKDRFDIVLANPPFGGGERKEVQQNFPIRSGETAYLFLQHFIRKLKAGGRGAVVIKNTFLSNTDNASVALRKELLETCNLHTVLDCPQGTFQGAGVKTVVLFFQKGSPTRRIWFYQLDPGRSMGKTNALNDDDLAEFVELQAKLAPSEKSWIVEADSLDEATFDLSVKNPNAPEAEALRSPEAIIDDMLARDTETAAILEDIRGDAVKAGWVEKPLGEVTDILDRQRKPITKRDRVAGPYPYYGATGVLDYVQGYLFDEPLVLLGEDGAKWGAGDPSAFQVSGKVWVNNHAHVLRPNRAKLLDAFLVYYLNFADLSDFISGMTVPKLNQGMMREIAIPLPPLDEQQRIVAILDEAFEGLARAKANAEANLASAKELFERWAAALFEEISNDPASSLASVKSLALPEKGSIRTGPFGSQLLHSEFVDEGIAVLGIDNAVSNQFRWAKKRFITPQKFEELRRYKVRPGDVIITIMGTCGRCAVIPDDIPVAINTKHLCCISLNPGRCVPEYLHRYFLLSPHARQYLTNAASGSVMDGLNMGIIKEMPVYVPDAPQQDRIIHMINDFEAKTQALITTYETNVHEAGELRQSLLAKAFSGELKQVG